MILHEPSSFLYLFTQNLFHVFCFVQEVEALLYTGNRIVVSILFNFNVPVFYIIGIHLIEDRLEVHLAACADFLLVLDMQNLDLISIFLHIPPEEGTPPLQQYIPYLPIGQRLFAVSLLAHEIYLRQDYAKAKGVVQGAFLMADGVYPISMIYLGCVQAMCQINLKEQEEAIQTVSQAWEWARFDKFMEPFIEYHGLLQGVLEVCIRKKESVMHLQAGIQMQNVRKSTKRICRIRI